ncbi:hypothetical protein HYR99_40105 [Candidatus Poribacteria bacterium]|nr:hypothetical protein [Candidatus Poribacteria bacterium]
MKLTLKNKKGHRLERLHRRLLPFYMKPIILIVFIVTSVAGFFIWSWITAVTLAGRANSWWCIIGFVLGTVLGYGHGKWTARMWARDYLRVLRREITFWEAKGATGTTVYVMLALGIPIFGGLVVEQSYDTLIGIQSYIFGFIGGMNLALYLWVRRLPR